jgi:hypothetical protein
MLGLKMQSAQDFADQQTKKLQNQSQRRTFDINKLSKEDIEILVRDIKRPFDHKNRRPFHFITIEKDGKVFLFDGLNRFVKAFEEQENETNHRFWENIRLHALNIFLKSERQTGGFLFN